MQIISNMLWSCGLWCLLGVAAPAYSQIPEGNQGVTGSFTSGDEGDDVSSALATDGAENIVAVWLEEGGIGISRSTNSGATWKPVHDLAQTSDTILEADVAYAGSGTYVTMWLQSPSRNVVQVKSMRSTDNGQTWSDPVTVPCSNPYQEIDMASNGAGTIIASLSGLRLSSFDYGVTWNESLPVTPSILVRVNRLYEAPITYASGQFFHAYLRDESLPFPSCIMPGSADCYFWHYIAAKSPDGINWTEARIIPQPSGWDGTNLADIAAIGNTVIVMGKDPVANGWAITMSTSLDGGDTWSPPVATGSTTTRNGKAILTANGNTWLLAHDLANSGIQVYTSSADAGSFSLLKELGGGTAPHRSPAALASGDTFLMTFDKLQVPITEIPTSDWDIWSAFAGTNAFTTGPIVSELTPSQEPMGPMLDTKLSIKLKFNKDGKDNIKLIGEVPIPSGFDPLGLPVIVDIGGIQRAFIMDGKGKANAGTDKLKLTVMSKKGLVESQLAKLQVNLKKGNFAAELLDEGMVNDDVEASVKVSATVQYGEDAAIANVPLRYKGKADKIGKAR